MNRSLYSVIAITTLAAAGCSGGGGNGDDGGRDGDHPPGDGGPPTDAGGDGPDVTTDPEGCPLLFAQDNLPSYYIDIAPDEWAKMNDEFVHVVEREANGLEREPLHPITFRYGSPSATPVPNAMMHLNGSTSWLQAIQFDANPKMQWIVSFNEIDPHGRFMGERKVQLDMPRDDMSFLRQRVALSYMRKAGVPAPCANNVRVYINGAYYGLYTNLERQDKEYLQRVFPAGEQDGDLWKGGRIIQNNASTFTWDRINALWAVTDLAGLASMADLDASMYEWASEVVIGDEDGYANGRANFLLYDHPTRGFIWLPNDLDACLDQDYLPADASPIVPPAFGRTEDDWAHYLIAMRDPIGVDHFVSAIATARARLDVTATLADLRTWANQIEAAAAEDPMKPFSTADHDAAVVRMLAYIPARAGYLDGWLTCRQSGHGDDGDGDGVDMCHDCDDHDRDVHPGAAEVCDLRDNDCDGHVDNVAGSAVCQ